MVTISETSLEKIMKMLPHYLLFVNKPEKIKIDFDYHWPGLKPVKPYIVKKQNHLPDELFEI